MVELCWKTNPKLRPTMIEVCQMIEQHLQIQANDSATVPTMNLSKTKVIQQRKPLVTQIGKHNLDSKVLRALVTHTNEVWLLLKAIF